MMMTVIAITLIADNDFDDDRYDDDKKDGNELCYDYSKGNGGVTEKVSID